MCRAVNRDRPGFFDAIVNCGEGEGRARRKGKNGSLQHVITEMNCSSFSTLVLCYVLSVAATNQY